MSHLQLGKDLADVPVTALGDVHVLLVRLLFEHRLGGVGEVLVEGEMHRHVFCLHLSARLRLHFTHVFFPTGHHLRQTDHFSATQTARS